MERGKRLTQNSKAVKLLRTLFEPGQIDEQDGAKDIRNAHEIFNKNHSGNALRTCFNNSKKEYGNLGKRISRSPPAMPYIALSSFSN